MSNIENNLKTIMEAHYGADVRQAIHDAIEDCYTDGKAGATDLVARQRLNEIASAMNTEYGSEVLWSDSTGVKAVGAEITLADNYDEFDYLDIYTYTTQRDAVSTFSTANSGGVIRNWNVTGSYTGLRLDEVTVSFSANKIVITDHAQWYWTGVADTAATITTIDSESAQYGTLIRKVVGRKIAANTEVADIRVGYDGTTYQSAGEAVRTQITQAIAGGGGTGLSDEAKTALLNCFAHVAWTDEYGQDYYDALEAALYPPADLVSISAVYTQSGTVYDTDTLDSLKPDLVVTAVYSDSTTETVTTYTLSGTLAEGTSTITVSYGGKTDTFDVTVTEYSAYTYYDYLYNNSASASDSSQYVDTGIIYSPNLNTLSMEMKFANTNSENASQAILGWLTSSNTDVKCFDWYVGKLGTYVSTYAIGAGAKQFTVTKDEVTVLNYDFVDGGMTTVTVDEVTTNMTTVSASTIASQPYGLVLLGHSNKGSIVGGHPNSVQLGYVKFTDSNNNLVYHFKPAYDSTTQKYGYHEAVNNVFYPATGANILGGNWE